MKTFSIKNNSCIETYFNLSISITVHILFGNDKLLEVLRYSYTTSIYSILSTRANSNLTHFIRLAQNATLKSENDKMTMHKYCKLDYSVYHLQKYNVTLH